MNRNLVIPMSQLQRWAVVVARKTELVSKTFSFSITVRAELVEKTSSFQELRLLNGQKVEVDPISWIGK